MLQYQIATEEHTGGLMQKSRNSIANELQLHLFCNESLTQSSIMKCGMKLLIHS